MSFISRGFRGRPRASVPEGRLPTRPIRDPRLPGAVRRADAQHPARPLDILDHGRVDERTLDLGGVPRAAPRTVTVDIHCVTKWSKFDTSWDGVAVDTILDGVETDGRYVVAHSLRRLHDERPAGGSQGRQGVDRLRVRRRPLEPEHGGPARLLVPHLYFWKSAKWVTSLRSRATDAPGFWEMYGYHNYGDPWREQRYQGD